MHVISQRRLNDASHQSPVGGPLQRRIEAAQPNTPKSPLWARAPPSTKNRKLPPFVLSLELWPLEIRRLIAAKIRLIPAVAAPCKIPRSATRRLPTACTPAQRVACGGRDTSSRRPAPQNKPSSPKPTTTSRNILRDPTPSPTRAEGRARRSRRERALDAESRRPGWLARACDAHL